MAEVRFIGLAALLMLAMVLVLGVRGLRRTSFLPTRLAQAIAVAAFATGWLQLLVWLSGPEMSNLGFVMVLVLGIGLLLNLPLPVHDRPQILANVAAVDLCLSIYWAIWIARVDHDVTNEVGVVIGLSMAQIIVVLTMGTVFAVRGFVLLVERRDSPHS